MAIKNDGTLWAWGLNDYGQLGNGESGYYDPPTDKLPIYSAIPVQVGTDTNWEVVSAGDSFSAAIKSDGSLWAWGRNDNFGQLGTGTWQDSNIPVQECTGANNWVAVSVGSSHAAAIKKDGSLWTWGKDDENELNRSGDNRIPAEVDDPDPSKLWVAAFSISISTVGIKEDGGIWAWGDNFSGSIPVLIIPAGDIWLILSAGAGHTVVIKKDGSLWAWGNNSYGQLGNNDPTGTYRSTLVEVAEPGTWKTISAKGNHTLAIKNDGSLWAWGSNNFGQLGSNTKKFSLIPIQIGKDKWTAVSTNYSHTVAIKSDGSLWAWGSNNYGQLGDGTTRNRTTITKVSAGD